MAALTVQWQNSESINYYLPYGLDASSLPQGVKWEDVDRGVPVDNLPNQIPTNWFSVVMCDNMVREQASVIHFFLPQYTLLEIYENIHMKIQEGRSKYSVFIDYIESSSNNRTMSQRDLAAAIKARYYADSSWKDAKNLSPDFTLVSKYMNHTICDIRPLIYGEYKFLFHFGGSEISYQLLAHQFYGCKTEAEFYVARHKMYHCVFSRINPAHPNPYSNMTQSQIFKMIFPNRAALQSALDAQLALFLALPTPNKKKKPDPQLLGDEQLQLLESIFPDADPNYLEDITLGKQRSKREFEKLIENLLEKKDYPTWENYTKRTKYINGLSMEEFLKEYPDPESVFIEKASFVSPEYKSLARQELLRIFPQLRPVTISTVLRRNNYHLYPAFLKLKNANDGEVMWDAEHKSTDHKIWQINDERFLKEKCFIRLESQIKDHFENRRFQREREMAFARIRGEFVTCHCCFEDQVLPTEMSSCSNEEDPHKFCNNCIRRFVEEEIGQNKLHFRCIQGECEQEFPVNVLEHVLLPKVYQKLIERRQAQEIEETNVPDLETCPFCTFASIIPNKEDKLFYCCAPECMQTSCRLCKKLSHIPQSCEENKNNSVRTYMENEMSKAIMRECYKCKKSFVKEDGCNKMRCVCGALMCYVCKQPIDNYTHFNALSFGDSIQSGSRCPMWSNSEYLHAEELRQRAAHLREEAGPDVQVPYTPEPSSSSFPRVSL